MVFNVIILLLFAAAIPLWGYRQYVFLSLEPRARGMFKRLAARLESAIGFAIRTFLTLLVIAGAVVVLVNVLSYIKDGRLADQAYSDVVRNRLYSGLDSVDPHIDTFLYEQSMPVMFVLTCLLLSIGLTLVLKPIEDIRLLKRLQKKLKRVQERSEEA